MHALTHSCRRLCSCGTGSNACSDKPLLVLFSTTHQPLVTCNSLLLCAGIIISTSKACDVLQKHLPFESIFREKDPKGAWFYKFPGDPVEYRGHSQASNSRIGMADGLSGMAEAWLSREAHCDAAGARVRGTDSSCRDMLKCMMYG